MAGRPRWQVFIYFNFRNKLQVIFSFFFWVGEVFICIKKVKGRMTISFEKEKKQHDSRATLVFFRFVIWSRSRTRIFGRIERAT